MSVQLQPTRLMVASRVLSDLAYVGLCLAAALVLFPELRLWLRARLALATYRLQVAMWQAGRRAPPAWTASLRREDLPPEEPPTPTED